MNTKDNLPAIIKLKHGNNLCGKQDVNDLHSYLSDYIIYISKNLVPVPGQTALDEHVYLTKCLDLIEPFCNQMTSNQDSIGVESSDPNLKQIATFIMIMSKRAHVLQDAVDKYRSIMS